MLSFLKVTYMINSNEIFMLADYFWALPSLAFLPCTLISCYAVFSDLQLTDSGLYTCTASSESGETSWSASLTVEKTAAPNLHRMPDPSTYPSPPPQPHILNTSQSSVTVSWRDATKTKPGASPLIGYTVEYFSSDLQTGWVVAANRVTADTITVSLWAASWVSVSCVLTLLHGNASAMFWEF